MVGWGPFLRVELGQTACTVLCVDGHPGNTLNYWTYQQGRTLQRPPESQSAVCRHLSAENTHSRSFRCWSRTQEHSHCCTEKKGFEALDNLAEMRMIASIWTSGQNTTTETHIKQIVLFAWIVIHVSRLHNSTNQILQNIFGEKNNNLWHHLLWC